ncbi:hypothetical protein O9G_003396 [Rozella allomycis CSF55]|uniref:DUF4832 domain-containing protein n=1 Tax=Rozella allomycis (strain CSF55) TaxID=988480 RepID=A0A075AZC8_ROZAC|nr:hypothetical protein O9G_003396 [Rozella allomycis CSF55]|eukprot:EPZ35504.1 hypothetical protein O9G_003396 [Rozella allomycis CSF55]
MRVQFDIDRIRQQGKTLLISFSFTKKIFRLISRSKTIAFSLSKIINENADVVTSILPFFDHNGNVASNSYKISKELLTHVTLKRSISATSVKDKQMLTKTVLALNEKTAFNENLESARVHIFNHKLLSSLKMEKHKFFISDNGTYNSLKERDFHQRDSLYGLTGGVVRFKNNLTNCKTVVEELRRFHYTYVSTPYEVKQEWKHQGCLSLISGNLGYRFVLLELNSTQTKDSVVIAFRGRNSGFASIYNKKLFRLVASSASTYCSLELDIDVRRWKPGKFFSEKISVSFPTRMKEDLTFSILITDELQQSTSSNIVFSNSESLDLSTRLNLLFTESVDLAPAPSAMNLMACIS